MTFHSVHLFICKEYLLKSPQTRQETLEHQILRNKHFPEHDVKNSARPTCGAESQKGNPLAPSTLQSTESLSDHKIRIQADSGFFLRTERHPKYEIYFE